MNLTGEQIKYINEHLRDKDKTYSVCAIAKKLAESNQEVDFTPEEKQQHLL